MPGYYCGDRGFCTSEIIELKVVENVVNGLYQHGLSVISSDSGTFNNVSVAAEYAVEALGLKR